MVPIVPQSAPMVSVADVSVKLYHDPQISNQTGENCGGVVKARAKQSLVCDMYLV